MSLITEYKTVSIVLAILLCCIIQDLTAQDIVLDIKSPSVVKVDEPFRLEYILKGAVDGTNFNIAESLNGLEIKSGPHISNNGRLAGTSEIWQSFLYIVTAKKKGIISLPIATIDLRGSQYETKKFELKVLAENENSSQYLYNIDAFLMTQISRSEIYEDEAAVLSCQLYTKVPLLSVKEIDYPVLEGFEVGGKPFYDHQGIPVFKKEKYKGTEYYVGDLRRITIYPNRAGQLVIPEVKASLTFNARGLNKKRGFYPGEVIIESVDKELKSEPIYVKVIKLPKKKPEDFSGAIGCFKMHSKMKNFHGIVGEIFPLKVVVEGDGDLNNVSVPILDLPDGIEVYDLVSNNDDIIFSDFGLQSERIFGYLLVARRSGIYTIPPARFVYLDVESGNYKTLISSEHTVSITEPEIKGTVIAYR